MRPVNEIVNDVIGQFQMVRNAPAPFFAAVALAALAIWYAMDWGYGRENSFLKTQNAEYRRLGGAPDDVRKRITALEDFARGRFLAPGAKNKLVARLRQSDSIKSKVTIVVVCEECSDFGDQIAAALKEAGWEYEIVSGVGYTFKGLILSSTPNSPRKPVTIAFGEALTAADLKFESIGNPDFNQPALFIGRRLATAH